MFSATDLAHCVIVHASMLLIVVHYCGDAAQFVCTRHCCILCSLGDVCLGAIEGCNMKKHLPIAFPKAVQWVYRYFEVIVRL